MSAAVGVIACGALALHVKAIARRRGWPVDIHPLPPELHNRPERIAPAVEELPGELDGTYHRLAVAYADCGTFGALDAVLGAGRPPGRRPLLRRLRGDAVRRAMAEEPGTYFLTDFLARTFDRTVWRSLGLDRHPDLRDAYFSNYTRVVYLRSGRRRASRRRGPGRPDAGPSARGARGRRGRARAAPRGAGRGRACLRR